MHGSCWLSLVTSLVVALPGPAADLSEQAEGTSADEQALRAAGLTTDGPTLLDFFRARVLSRVAREKATLVVVDGVFSMGGDIAPLPALVEVCRRYGARLVVDDAHGIGVLGDTGRDTASHFGLGDESTVDVQAKLPNGKVITKSGVRADQNLVVEEP